MGRHIFADWALISKEPGAREDYGILAASAAQIDAGSLAAMYVAGTPNSSLPVDAPGAAPWVTFGSHLHAGRRAVLSISVQDQWQGRDQTGRPIWPRRLFACWYDDAAASCPSYRTLWEAVADEKLPRADRGPVSIGLPPDTADRTITAIGKIGLERVAAIAAALLDGPVAITGTADLRLSDGTAAVDRLGVLDAVAALLPYGFRADLSVSTAVDNAVAHRVRLVLAGYASAGQQAAGLCDDPITPEPGAAKDYKDMLLERAHAPGGLSAVVAHLRAATTVCAFDRPEAALRILDELNRPWHKMRAAEESAEGLDTSLSFFSGDPSETESMWRSPDLDRQAWAAGQLRAAAERVIANPEVLRRHADERLGVPTSVLALGMYRAWRAEMPPARISEVMARASVRDATLGQRVGHRQLDDVLREFAGLLAVPPREATGQPGTPDDGQAQARDVLAEFRELVCGGALGASYGAEFRRHLDMRLRDEIKAARQARRRLRRPIWPLPRRGRQRSGPQPGR